MSTDGFNNQSGSQNSGGSSEELGLPLTIRVILHSDLVGLILVHHKQRQSTRKSEETAGISALVGFRIVNREQLQIIAAILSA
jgi:hypothetical protein